jgi:Rrf2 family transcriptional regulator, iron-sulfur cluster assembly transcription factor
MKINALDEYGLRLMIRIAKADQTLGLSIPQLSELEGLSSAYVAKITRSLREGGLIVSCRGHKGGYSLAKPAIKITIGQILKVLGGQLYDKSFCDGHSGELNFCTNSIDCSVRSLWRILQNVLDHVLDDITLEEMLQNENQTENKLNSIANKVVLLQNNMNQKTKTN